MPPEAIALLEGTCLKAAAVQLEPDMLHTLYSLYAFYHRPWCRPHGVWERVPAVTSESHLLTPSSGSAWSLSTNTQYTEKFIKGSVSWDVWSDHTAHNGVPREGCYWWDDEQIVEEDEHNKDNEYEEPEDESEDEEDDEPEEEEDEEPERGGDEEKIHG